MIGIVVDYVTKNKWETDEIIKECKTKGIKCQK